MTTEPRQAPYSAPPAECRACPYPTACVTPPSGNQVGNRIAAAVALDCIHRGLTPQGSIRQLLDNLQEQVRRAADARYGPGAGARLSGGLQNVRGDWLEYVLGLIFWNVVAQSSYDNAAIVKLPSASQLRFHELYEPRAKSYLEELFESLRAHGIKMTMSNPDFICVTNLPDEVAATFRTPMQMSETSVRVMDRAYQRLRGLCRAEAVPFALTVKTSIRSDRRYQIVHEANVVKAFLAHLAGRFWRQNLYTGFYAMVASRLSPRDREVFSNPATHSLVQVSWTPVPLVDQVYEIDSVEEVQEIVEGLLKQYLSA